MDTTHAGYIPILYQVLAGNTVDITRPLPHLEQLLAFLARPEVRDRHLRPLLVSHCKMITPEAVLACHFYDLYYLGAVADNLAREAVLRSLSPAELNRHPLAYRPQRVGAEDGRFVPYAGVWRRITFEHGGQRVSDRVLLVWSAGTARLDQQKRRTYLKRLLNRLERIQQQLNSRRYKRRSYVAERIQKLHQGNPAQTLVDVELDGEDGALSLSFRLDSDRLQAAQLLDGRYLLTTNADHLDANQTLTLFKGQDAVEKRFRTLKDPLLVRPLFVHTDQRIEGLIFISLLALLLRSLLEQQVHQRAQALTASRLLRTFTPLQAVDLYWRDGSHQRQSAQPTPDQTQILATLGWSEPSAYARLPSC